ncbi:uncharacterized protein LOC115440559 [Manduca sexta]|uniref:Uncharacterized protein n=1 Tax=Manduca sexta TaxID=7130 RepID=A0A921YU44_MANSE|nr:uncharacterized protein LOC115440559 [Manduca sexta]KAG6445571.1 hypothetical protein O3G_MSEX004018 [Manduca sexta]
MGRLAADTGWYNFKNSFIVRRAASLRPYDAQLRLELGGVKTSSEEDLVAGNHMQILPLSELIDFPQDVNKGCGLLADGVDFHQHPTEDGLFLFQFYNAALLNRKKSNIDV